MYPQITHANVIIIIYTALNVPTPIADYNTSQLSRPLKPSSAAGIVAWPWGSRRPHHVSPRLGKSSQADIFKFFTCE